MNPEMSPIPEEEIAKLHEDALKLNEEADYQVSRDRRDGWDITHQQVVDKELSKYKDTEEVPEISPEEIETVMAELRSLEEVLTYYDEYRRFYHPIGDEPLPRSEVIEHFRTAPTLFHKAWHLDEKKAMDVARHGLMTPLFRQELRRRTEDEKPRYDYIDPRSKFTKVDIEPEKTEWGRKNLQFYNKKYISLSWIPWWGSPWTKNENVGDIRTEHGDVADMTISIALKPSVGRKIIEGNLNASSVFMAQHEVPQTRSQVEIGRLARKRIVQLNETVRSLRIAPRSFGAIFIRTQEGIDSDPIERRDILNLINRMGRVSKVPIFDYFGNLIWPQQMTREEVKQYIAGHGTEDNNTIPQDTV